MPYQTLLRVALHHALDKLVGGEVLLVATDDLDAAVFVIGGKEREVLQDVQHHLGPEHTRDCGLDVAKLACFLMLAIAPWAPHVDGHANGAIAEELALTGEGEHVRNEHRW